MENPDEEAREKDSEGSFAGIKEPMK